MLQSVGREVRCLMVGALDSGASGPGSSSGQGHCVGVVFLRNLTLF